MPSPPPSPPPKIIVPCPARSVGRSVGRRVQLPLFLPFPLCRPLSHPWGLHHSSSSRDRNISRRRRRRRRRGGSDYHSWFPLLLEPWALFRDNSDGGDEDESLIFPHAQRRKRRRRRSGTIGRFPSSSFFRGLFAVSLSQTVDENDAALISTSPTPLLHFPLSTDSCRFRHLVGAPAGRDPESMKKKMSPLSYYGFRPSGRPLRLCPPRFLLSLSAGNLDEGRHARGNTGTAAYPPFLPSPPFNPTFLPG